MKTINVTINSRNIDGSPRHRWTARLVEENYSLLEFVGEFDREIIHQHLGVIRRKTVSHEFYWLDRCYNVFRFHEPDGSLRNFYCNINLPPIFNGQTLDYVDLDVDVVVWRDFVYEILDADEFEMNARKYGYSDDLRIKVAAALNELIILIENKIFPFDYKF